MWDERRERLGADLGSQDAICGGLYRRAIDTMGSDSLTEVDLMVTAQAMRELVNRFPRVTGTAELPPGRSTRDDVASFVETWEAHIGRVEATDEEGLVDGVLPRSAIDAARKLVANFRAGNASNWRLRSALVLGRTDVDSDPTVREVARAIGDFERVRHPQGDTTAWLATEKDRVLAAIEVVENALEARLGSFFGVVDQLKDVLDRANSSQVSLDGTVVWSAPDERDLRDVVSRLGDVQHRRVFFGALRNPLWLGPLADRGLFTSTPAHQVDADGRWVWTLWPEGEYLAAIAPVEPARVAAILKLAVKPGAAHDARRQLLRAALAMPPDDAATLVSTLEPFIEPAMDYQFGSDLVELIKKLAAGGRLRKARALAWKLLRPRAGAERLAGVEVESVIDRHWYAEAMEQVLAALRAEPTLLTWLANRLADAERIARADSLTGDHDFSYIWRPAVGIPSRRHDRGDVRHILIDAVRDVATERLANGHPINEVISILEGTGASILRRISLHVLAQHLRASNPADQETLQLGLERLASEELIDNHAVRSEYLMLARETLPQLTNADFERWSRIFAAYPQLEPHQADWLTNHLAEGESLEEALADHAEAWRHHQLTAIGASALRGDRLAELTRLNDKRGELEVSEVPSQAHRSFNDCPSPFDAEQLGAMTAAEVLETLRTWQADSDDLSRPNKNGLGREFGFAVRHHTLEYSRVAEAALTQPHIYVSRYLDGLREGVKDHGGELDWKPLLSALPRLPSRSDEHRPDDGPDSHGWAYPIRQAIALVGLGAHDGSNPLPVKLLLAAAAFVARYLTDPDPAADPEPDSEQNEELPYGSGPLQQAINAVRSEAIRVLADLALYEHGQTEASARPGPVATLTVERLSQLMTPGRDGSSAVAAALGEAYGKILTIAPDWIQKHRAQLLSADAFGDVVVTTALVCYPTSRPLMRSLAPNLADLIRRASRGDRIAEGWRVDRTILQRIGDHLLVMYLWGAYGLDTPLIGQFFHEAPPEVRGSVLGHLGWLFLGDDDDIPDDILQRARQLWEARATEVTEGRAGPVELRDFYWWVHCGKFPIEWWLPLLKQAADATDFEGRTYLGEHLAEAARTSPRMTIEVLSRLLQSAPRPMARYNLIENAPAIIARGLDCGDAEAAQEAQRLMDWLGKIGYLEIKDRVDQAREDR